MRLLELENPSYFCRYALNNLFGSSGHITSPFNERRFLGAVIYYSKFKPDLRL